VGKLVDRLELLRLRPGLYVGEDSVEHLQTYVNGYRDGLRDCGVEEDELAEDFELLDTFRMWLAIDLKCKQSIGWGGMAEMKIGSSLNKLRMFYELYDKFNEEMINLDRETVKNNYEILVYGRVRTWS